MDQFSYIANADTAVISDLYESYQQDPNSVDASWQNFFKGFDFYTSWSGEASSTEVVHLSMPQWFRKKCL
jgi:2-oxoglutarate dehydrogenase E1 component